MRQVETDGGEFIQPPFQEGGIAEGGGGCGNAADGAHVGVSIEERILTHPLFGEPVIKTAPDREAYLSLRKRILTGVWAFTVLGQPEMDLGETLRVLHLYLTQEYPHLAVYQHVVSRSSSRTHSGVMSGLLASAGHAILRGGDEDKMARLLNMQEEKALVSGSPLSVWMIHNAERLDVCTCKALLDMRNALMLKGIRLLLIHGAHVHPFMRHIPALRRELEETELRTLFGSIHAHRGLSGLEEYAEVLMEIDGLTVSNKSPVTWTEALFPQAYADGFRLKGQAPALHAAILERSTDGKFSRRALFDTIRSVVSISARQDSSNFNIPQEAWMRAVSMVMGIGSGYLLGTSRLKS